MPRERLRRVLVAVGLLLLLQAVPQAGRLLLAVGCKGF
jgi:hypothetical protein